ncbi:MAG: hypothetical protein MJZ83_04615 [Bacteroidaceae bacterium]|nr:hypothetical protein [Bacteroidaceae bacterium]
MAKEIFKTGIISLSEMQAYSLSNRISLFHREMPLSSAVASKYLTFFKIYHS